MAHDEPFNFTDEAVLVVGCGFIGRHMARKLAGLGCRVSVLNRRDPGGGIQAAVARVMVGDADDPRILSEAVRGVDRIVWCAGGLMPNEAERDPDDDRARTLNPLSALVSIGPLLAGKSVTYISSGGTIYGNPGTEPVSEDQEPDPIGAYGRTKLTAEDMLQEAATRDAFRLRILRCSNVYGPGQPSDRSQGAVAVFTDHISRGIPIQVFGDGDHFRDYVHVDDVVRATHELWRVDGPVVLNCGSGVPVTITGLIEALEVAIGRSAVIERLPARSFDVDGIVLDVTRIRELIEFEPIDLPTGLGLSLSLGSR